MKRELPAGWTVAALAEVVGEPQYGLSNANVADGEVAIVGMKDMMQGRVDVSALARTTISARERAAFRLQPGDLLLNRTNSRELVGKLAVWDHPPAVEAVFASYLVRYPERPDVAIPRYVLACLEQADARQQIQRLVTPGVSQANINPSAFYEEVAIPVAPVSEQRQIVAALDVWERAIDRTERLISAKRRRRKALLQIAFQNLPRRPFLEAATVWFSGVDKKTKSGEQDVLLCNYMDVFHNARITRHLPFMRSTASKREIAQNTLRRNDVVFTKDSETADEIAEPALVDEDIEGLVCGYHLAIARPIEGRAYGPFIAQAMRHPEMRWQFCRLANGVVRFGLTLDAIEQAEIFLPDFDVQFRIASALDAEDRLIEALNALAESLRVQRRGLIQRLLTGQWRVDREAV